jgi:hypothetical protein
MGARPKMPVIITMPIMPEKIFSMLLLVKNKLAQPENLVKQKIDDFAKSLLKRHPGEPRIRSGAGAGVQTSPRRKSRTISKTGSRFSPGTLDSGFRRNNKL